MIIEGLAIVGIITVAHKVKKWWHKKDEDDAPESKRDKSKKEKDSKKVK